MNESNLDINLLEQLPGYVYLQNKESHCLACNSAIANWFGYNHPKDILGRSVFDIPIIEHLAEGFYNQNLEAYQQEKQLKMLEFTYDKNNEFFACLIIKKPFYDSKGNKLGVIGQGFDLDQNSIIKLSQVILNTTKANRIENGSYYIENQVDEYNLTPRETECLFYLLRGKTTKEIGSILSLSPRTIESYLDSIKLKMNCHKKGAVIEKAINSGLLYLIPHTILNI